TRLRVSCGKAKSRNGGAVRAAFIVESPLCISTGISLICSSENQNRYGAMAFFFVTTLIY
ncbi:MAG TPA: hypothetical protein PKA69_11755, partial [Lacibacter sp.]|nr:hypothetical protein [Lacibacter sp.]